MNEELAEAIQIVVKAMQPGGELHELTNDLHYALVDVVEAADKYLGLSW